MLIFVFQQTVLLSICAILITTATSCSLFSPFRPPLLPAILADFSYLQHLSHVKLKIVPMASYSGLQQIIALLIQIGSEIKKKKPPVCYQGKQHSACLHLVVQLELQTSERYGRNNFRNHLKKKEKMN